MALELAGPASVDPDDEGGAELQRIVLNSFHSSIAGGTDEIQRNIIGDRVLGLSRERSANLRSALRTLRPGGPQSAAHWDAAQRVLYLLLPQIRGIIE